MHRCVHKRVHRVLVDVSVSVRKCVCTCSQVDSCTGTFAHVYVSTGVHKCARRCSRVQVWMHAEVLTCVCMWSHTQCSHMCTSERAQACTSAPVGVCAHVCACAGPLLARSAAHMGAVSAHTARCARLASRRANTRVCAHTAVPPQNGFAVIRPPGHHAEESAAM